MAAEIDNQPPPNEVRLDRSLLESYANCPFQGHAIETGKVRDDSIFALSGTEAHDPMAAIVHEFVSGRTSTNELATEALAMAMNSNPLVQPDVLKAVRPSVYRFAWSLINGEDGRRRNPADVKRYQGGEGKHDSQLTARLGPLAEGDTEYLLTSEIDLLMAGWNEHWLCETDWKTGHTIYSATSIRESFQFQMHAWLLSENYPGLEGVSIRVWNTRIGSATPWVDFRAQDFSDFRMRALRILAERERAYNPKEEPLFNPYVETCCNCAATAICPAVIGEGKALAADPQAFLAETAARMADVAHRKKALYVYCRKNGELHAAGLVCGEKAPSTRKPSMTIYEDKSSDDAGEGE